MAKNSTLHQGYFGRLGGAFKGMLTGLFLVFGAIALLFWNEGRAVKRARALKEGAAATIPVNPSQIDPGNQGRLIHFSGPLTVHGTLSDPLFDGDFAALALLREVEMYQWTEETHSEEKINVGGSSDTIVSNIYKKTWSSLLIPSGNFKEPGHDNPEAFPVPSLSQYAKGVTIGAFRIPDDCIPSLGRLSGVTAPSVTNALPAAAPPGLIRTTYGYYFSAAGATNVPPEAAIGDAKITLAVAEPCDASFVAVQQGDTLAAYTAKNGGRLFLQANGAKTADEMFASAESANKTATTLLRILGFVVMFLGFGMLLGPLKVLMDVMPFLGRVVGAGISAISFLLALVVSLVTIAIAWITYRPVLAVALLAVAGGAGYLVWKKTHAEKENGK